MKHANSEIHAPLIAEETLCLALAKKVMFIGPNNQQVFPRANINFRIQFVESEEGTQIALVFEEPTANPGGRSKTGNQSLSFILNDALSEPLLERLTAIVPKEIQSFFLAVEIVPSQELPRFCTDNQVHLNARFGDYHTRSAYSVDLELLAHYVDLAPTPSRPLMHYIH